MKHLITGFLIVFLTACGGSKNAAQTATASDTVTPVTDTADTTTYTSDSIYAGSVTLTASPSTAVTLGNTIQISATPSGISDPSYNFFYVSGGNISGVSASQNGNIAAVTSTANAVVVLGVTVRSLSNSSLQASSQITLQFGNGASSSTTTITIPTASDLSCYLTHNSMNAYRYGNINFYLTSNTGEQLRLVSWDPGEAWDTAAPTFPLSLPTSGLFYGYYVSRGTKVIRIVAESVSRPGVFCNGGATITDSVVIY